MEEGLEARVKDAPDMATDSYKTTSDLTYQPVTTPYEGLTLLDVTPFAGGTSIKYWM